MLRGALARARRQRHEPARRAVGTAAGHGKAAMPKVPLLLRRHLRVARRSCAAGTALTSCHLAGGGQRLTERLSRPPGASRDLGESLIPELAASAPQVSDVESIVATVALQRPVWLPPGAYPTLWVQLSLQALPDHKRSFSRA